MYQSSGCEGISQHNACRRVLISPPHGNISVEQMREHLNTCATRVFEKLRRDAIAARPHVP